MASDTTVFEMLGSSAAAHEITFRKPEEKLGIWWLRNAPSQNLQTIKATASSTISCSKFLWTSQFLMYIQNSQLCFYKHPDKIEHHASIVDCFATHSHIVFYDVNNSVVQISLSDQRATHTEVGERIIGVHPVPDKVYVLGLKSCWVIQNGTLRNLTSLDSPVLAFAFTDSELCICSREGSASAVQVFSLDSLQVKVQFQVENIVDSCHILPNGQGVVLVGSAVIFCDFRAGKPLTYYNISLVGEKLVYYSTNLVVVLYREVQKLMAVHYSPELEVTYFQEALLPSKPVSLQFLTQGQFPVQFLVQSDYTIDRFTLPIVEWNRPKPEVRLSERSPTVLSQLVSSSVLMERCSVSPYEPVPMIQPTADAAPEAVAGVQDLVQQALTKGLEAAQNLITHELLGNEHFQDAHSLLQDALSSAFTKFRFDLKQTIDDVLLDAFESKLSEIIASEDVQTGMLALSELDPNYLPRLRQGNVHALGEWLLKHRDHPSTGNAAVWFEAVIQSLPVPVLKTHYEPILLARSTYLKKAKEVYVGRLSSED